MNNPPVLRRSLSQDRTKSSFHTRRSQSVAERYHHSELGLENVAPVLMPSGLNSMLKNTTETGDIGLFSIKPSRLPRHISTSSGQGAPRSARNGYQDYAAQSLDFSVSHPRAVVDDRKRLPSYTRDVTSEIVSLYETTSQKSSGSSKFFDDTEQRSYSLTQTSHSGSRLTTHRSYASLRSQVDQNLGQRPRSPFPYPARLRRPGFRPCSPALTDGGAVDYSRRAEIDRELPLSKTPSSSTIIVHKRVPSPLSLRSDINRSVPGSFGSDPIRQRSHEASKPSIGERSLKSLAAEEIRRGSPSPSNRSASIVSEVRQPSRASSTAAGKAPLPSPVYYDYSENFFPEDDELAYQDPEVLPSPPFHLERTIHEDRELSSDWSYLAMTDLQGRGFLASEGLLMSQIESLRSLPHKATDTAYVGAVKASPLRSVESFSDADVDKEQLNYNVAVAKKMVPQVHRQMAHFGLDGANDRGSTLDSNPSPVEGESEPETSESAEGGNDAWDRMRENQTQDSNARSRSKFPFKEAHQKSLPADISRIDQSTPSVDHLSDLPPEQRIRDKHVSDPLAYAQVAALNVKSKAAAVGKNESSPTMPMSPAYSSTDGHASKEAIEAPRDGYAVSKGLQLEQPSHATVFGDVEQDVNPECTVLRRVSHHPDRVSEVDLKAKLSRFRSDGDLKARQPDIYSTKSREWTDPGPSAQLWQDQSSRQSFLSEPSEILSPTPVYPARELHVKNSIPHLMKTLPLRKPFTEQWALPAVRTSKPRSKRPAPLQLHPRNTDTVTKAIDKPTEAESSLPSMPATPLETLTVEQPVFSTRQPFLSRFRLKARSTPTHQPQPPPPGTRPWNLEESYPWSANSEHSPNLSTGSFSKMRMKLAQGSNTSLGTVRVNPERASSNPVAGGVNNPKDLFASPSSGLINIFRQVSRRFQSNEGSLSSDGNSLTLLSKGLAVSQSANGRQSAIRVSERTVAQITVAKGNSVPTRKGRQQRDAVALKALPSLDGAASSDFGIGSSTQATITGDTSPSLKPGFQACHQETVVTVRKKLSGLKAKLPVSSNWSLSRQSADAMGRPKTAASSSNLLQHDAESSSRRSRRLKSKISFWFRGAKATVLGCVRTRSGTDQSGEAIAKAPMQ